MVSARGISRPLQTLTIESATALSAQLGVYELVDGDDVTVLLGQAGGLEPFGLRSALQREAATGRADLPVRIHPRVPNTMARATHAPPGRAR